MTLSASPARFLLFGLATFALVQPARAASEYRRILCDRRCTLVLKAATGTIDIKIPTASASLKTLAKYGDSFELEAGKDYVLKLNESPDGLFSFDLQFSPHGSGSTWSCRVKTLSIEPFIGVEQDAWSGAAGKVTINADRAKPFITINSHS
jgi:hypothetical protein